MYIVNRSPMTPRTIAKVVKFAPDDLFGNLLFLLDANEFVSRSRFYKSHLIPKATD